MKILPKSQKLNVLEDKEYRPKSNDVIYKYLIQ